MRDSLLIGFLTVGAITMSSQASAQKFNYPDTKVVDQVDEFHGTKVADPYRWLEDDVHDSKEVADWVKEQNKLTFGYLKAIHNAAKSKPD